jgi:hypothetical protein
MKKTTTKPTIDRVLVDGGATCVTRAFHRDARRRFFRLVAALFPMQPIGGRIAGWSFSPIRIGSD